MERSGDQFQKLSPALKIKRTMNRLLKLTNELFSSEDFTRHWPVPIINLNAMILEIHKFNRTNVLIHFSLKVWFKKDIWLSFSMFFHFQQNKVFRRQAPTFPANWQALSIRVISTLRNFTLKEILSILFPVCFDYPSTYLQPLSYWSWMLYKCLKF